MSNYIINFTDPLKGSFLIRPYTSNGPKFPTTSVLNDTSIAANSTLLLFGKGHPEYGERTDENLLNLLENFSGATEPVVKNAGMLWHKEVLYSYDNVGGDFYVAGAGSPLWTNITLFADAGNPGALPALPPAGLQDGDYWFDNTGSPTILYQYSADERNINDWIVREFTEVAGVPTAAPVKEMQVYDGDAWDVLPDLSAVNALLLGSGFVLKTGDTMSGDLDIQKATPTLSLTGTAPTLNLSGTDGRIQFGNGSPFAWEIQSDDSGTGDLTFSNGGTQYFEISAAGILSVDLPLYEAAISADNDIPNKRYVDALVTGAVLGDTFVDAGTFGIAGSPSTGTLSLIYNAPTGSPSVGSLTVTGFDSDQIPFISGQVGGTEPAATVDIALTAAAPTNNPFFSGTVTIPSLTGAELSTVAANKGYVDNQIASVSGASIAAPRSVQSGGSTTFNLPFNFTAGNNRLMVFKNGIKQYRDIVIASVLAFSPEIQSGATALSGLGPPGGYQVNNVVPGLDIWVITGNFATDFTAGDTFTVVGNSDGASNLTYTIVSATNVGPDTDLTVSPATIPGTAAPDGLIGINYNFQMTVDGTGPLTVGLPGGLNGLNLITFDNLITNLQAAIDATFGAGLVAVYINAGNIQMDNLGDIAGSPAPFISVNNGLVPTTDIFGFTNLVVDGFAFFGGAGPDQFAYFESDGGSPIGVAPGGSLTSSIEFNATTLGTDVIEFLLV